MLPEGHLIRTAGQALVRKIRDRDTLKSLLGRVTTAATKDRDKGVREYAGRAMHHIQHVLKEQK